MIQFPNCKINIGLNITAKRSDGFHNLETVFYPVPLHDLLEIMTSPDGDFHFQSSGLPIPGDAGKNLCTRAYQLLKTDFGLQGVSMHLHKVIPMGSGLGGGSADGAFTLKLLNDLFSLGLNNETLRDYARRLGSDCAFFIDNKPTYAFGRGDEFEPVQIDLTGLFLALVIPDLHVDTAEAFGMVNPLKPLRSIKELLQIPMENWKELVVNDFEQPIFNKYPEIGEIKRKLYESGAVFASMSGSGSAVYGIFKSVPDPSDFQGYDCQILQL